MIDKLLIALFLLCISVWIIGVLVPKIQKVEIYDAAKSFSPYLLVAILLKALVFSTFVIPTSSMVPSYPKGAFIVGTLFNFNLWFAPLEKHLVSIARPARGEVVMFKGPKGEKTFIKRVVGIPGDTVEYKNKNLLVNGKTTLVSESEVENRFKGNIDAHQFIFQLDPEYKNTKAEGVWEIPPDHYFMMGDNRDHSYDSRFFGPISGEQILGKVYKP